MFTEAFDRDLPKRKKDACAEYKLILFDRKLVGDKHLCGTLYFSFCQNFHLVVIPSLEFVKHFQLWRMSANTFYWIFGWHLYMAIFLMNLICLRQKFNLVHQWRRTHEKACSCSKNLYVFLLLLPYLRLILFCFKKKIIRNKWKKPCITLMKNNLFRSVEVKWAHTWSKVTAWRQKVVILLNWLWIATDFIKHHHKLWSAAISIFLGC